MADEHLKHKHGEIKTQTLEVGIMNAANQQSSGPIVPIGSGPVGIGPEQAVIEISY